MFRLRDGRRSLRGGGRTWAGVCEEEYRARRAPFLRQDGDYGTFAALFVLVENAQFHAARTLIPRFSHARFIVFRRISF